MISFDFVTTRLATGGGITTEVDVAALKSVGITHVIDCRDDVDDAGLLEGSGLVYLWNPTADDGQTKPKEWFQKGIVFALEEALKLPGTKLYSHCHVGRNRGPSMAAAIMMAQGWSEALTRADINIHRLLTIGGIRYINDARAAVEALGYV